MNIIGNALISILGLVVYAIFPQFRRRLLDDPLIGKHNVLNYIFSPTFRRELETKHMQETNLEALKAFGVSHITANALFNGENGLVYFSKTNNTIYMIPENSGYPRKAIEIAMDGVTCLHITSWFSHKKYRSLFSVIYNEKRTPCTDNGFRFLHAESDEYKRLVTYLDENFHNKVVSNYE